MKILLSNDDGVYAKGLNVLAEFVKEIAEINVVAPDRNHSGASHSLSLTRPLHASRLANGYISVDGTPTDCVHLAITGFLDEAPDMVIAGINEGANLGDDVLYSGTVAAATEGRFLGFPAVAVSLASKECRHYETAARVVCDLMLGIHKLSLPAQTILNINVPDIPYEEVKGFEITRLGTRHQAEPTIQQIDPRGNTIYWIGPPGLEEDAGVGTDFYAIATGKVSITPIKVDLTNYQAIDKMKALENFF